MALESDPIDSVTLAVELGFLLEAQEAVLI
jgi:hypothetical protein